jgi:hypothetical protein
MPYEHASLKREIDTYQDTVWAIVAFILECRWNPSDQSIDETIPVGVGRVFRKTDGSEVTPDLAVQRRPAEGIVAEVKATFPPEQSTDRRNEIFQQLKTYDDDLLGWWTNNGQIQRHDIVLLTHDTHVVEACDHLSTLDGTEIGTFDRNLAILGFYRTDQRETFLTLRKHSGEFLDRKFGEKLRRGVPINVGHIEYQQKKFYDSRPPIPYILEILWDYIFPDYTEGSARDPRKGYTPIEVTKNRVTGDMQRFYGFEPDDTGNRGTPRSEWIEEALESLVSLRMAHHGNGEGAYVIRYKGIKGDTLERFGKLLHERDETHKRQAERRRRQPTLFDNM